MYTNIKLFVIESHKPKKTECNQFKKRYLKIRENVYKCLSTQ